MSEAIRDAQDFRIMSESQDYILGSVWESIYLVNKVNGDEISMGMFNGVTDIGLIDNHNQWAIAAREIILIWKKGEVIEIDTPELKCVEGIELINDHEIKLTIDTSNLNGNRSVWKINMDSLSLSKIV